MKMPIPSLNGLRYFEAAARHGSFTQAAEELFVTPAAVSYQIRQLETELGLQLFNRQARWVVLTEAGTMLHAHVQTAFGAIGDGIREARESQQSGPLHVSLVPSFAQQWLLPRLDQFNQAYPDIHLRINATARLADFKMDGNHCAVRLGNGNWGSGLIVEKLIEERLFPVCCPDLAARFTIETPVDLLKMPLLHNDFYPWQEWFKALEIEVPEIPKGPTFDDANLLLVASLQGMGVCLVRTTVAQGNLARARLVRPVSAEVVGDQSYYLVIPERFRDHAGVIAFREWILSQARLDACNPCRLVCES